MNIENKILIVDDNPTNLKLLFDYLSGEKGNKIFVAKNGREALERVGFAVPDIILLDIMMPEMDGYEACRRLKENKDTREIPIIFLTAFADTESKIKAFDRGAVDFIVKPFNQKEVLARINTHLTLSRQKKALEKANHDLAKANATKDKLFSIVAHDMRNKFFGVTGNIQLLDNFFHDFTDDEKHQKIRDLAGSAQQVYTLFENLFSWARTQTTEIKVVPEKINLFRTAKEMVDIFCKDAQSKGVELLSLVGKGCEVVYDKNMLLFILRNLVNNAIKYCDHGNRVVISFTQEGGTSRISVKDTGIGMTPELCESIFDLGVKSSCPGTRKEAGSGLGLIVAKEFAELNHSSLSMASEKGSGTEVVLSF